MASFFIDIEKLIKEVEKRPGLYHKDAAEYNDKNAKIKLWIEVCEAVIPNWHKMSQHEKNSKGKDVQNRWRNLRDCFRKELNLQKKILAHGAKPKRRKYIYFDALLFLLPALQDRQIVENYNSLKHEPNTSTNQEDEGEEATRSTPDRDDGEDQDYQEADETQESRVDDEQFYRESRGPEKRRKIISYEEDPLELSRHNSREDEIDEDKLYLLSLLPSFKRLTHQQKVLIKVEYLQALHRILYESEQSSVISTVNNQSSFDLNSS